MSRYIIAILILVSSNAYGQSGLGGIGRFSRYVGTDTLMAYSDSSIVYFYNDSLYFKRIPSATAVNLLSGGSVDSVRAAYKADRDGAGNVITSTYVPQARTITINGTTQDLSANRTYTVDSVRAAWKADSSAKSLKDGSGNTITSTYALQATNNTAGDGLAGGGTLAAGRDYSVNVDFDGAIETVDDSLNVKLYGTTLTKSANGLSADTAVLATQFDISTFGAASKFHRGTVKPVAFETDTTWAGGGANDDTVTVGIPSVAKITTSLAVPQINDANGNEVLKFTTTASAVNEVTIANAATNTNPVISATGGDTDITLVLAAKGAGDIAISNNLVTPVPSTFELDVASGKFTTYADVATVEQGIPPIIAYAHDVAQGGDVTGVEFGEFAGLLRVSVLIGISTADIGAMSANLNYKDDDGITITQEVLDISSTNSVTQFSTSAIVSTNGTLVLTFNTVTAFVGAPVYYYHVTVERLVAY